MNANENTTPVTRGLTLFGLFAALGIVGMIPASAMAEYHYGSLIGIAVAAVWFGGFLSIGWVAWTRADRTSGDGDSK